MEHAGSRLSLDTERLAHHALNGGEWGRAAQYLHLAGRRAIAQARYANGVGFYEAAIGARGKAIDGPGRGVGPDAQ